MIKKLDNNDPKMSENIRTVFQISYAVEAELLQAPDFPPLKRSLKNFQISKNNFFGYIKNGQVVGVIEIDSAEHSTHIQSLVVHPQFFREGIASKLIDFVLQKFDSKLFSVETGVKNIPAIQLYKKWGFIESKQWDTVYRIKKIRLIKKYD